MFIHHQNDPGLVLLGIHLLKWAFIHVYITQPWWFLWLCHDHGTMAPWHHGTMALGHPPRLGAQVAVHRSRANAAGRRSMRHRRAPHRIRSDLVSPGLRECQRWAVFFLSDKKNIEKPMASTWISGGWN